MIRPAFTAIAALLALSLASGVAHAQDESATYTMTFQGLWTVDDITDASMPGGAHFTEVIGATHNSGTTIWASGGTASAGVENVAELGSVGTLLSEIGQNPNADVIVRAGSSFITPTQTVSGAFTMKASHPLVSVLSMVAPTPDWFVGVSNLRLYDNGWQNRVVDLYPYDAGTEEGSGWSLSNAATIPQAVIASIRNTGRFRGNPIARLSFTTDQTTDNGQTTGGGTVSPVVPVVPPVMIEPRSAHYTVPLLVPSGTSGGALGVLRILNDTAESGPVDIYAIDDSGTRSGPARFTLGAWAAAEFTATDLRSGNVLLDLAGGVGPVRDARLHIATDLRIVPLAYVRAADGTLSAMHDTVSEVSADGSGKYDYEVPIFNPSSDATQVSRLRLINPGDAAASITISGRDDSGAVATGGDVTLMLAAGGAQTLTAQQLEAGDTAITGRLGAGTGKWRLTVSSDQPLQVVNIVAATAGYWNNLSTTAAPGAAPTDLESINERFVGNAVVYVTGNNRFTLNAQTGERFTETAEIDGVSTTYMGSYGYSAIGPDAGRLTVTYDDGDVCAANLYFSTHTAGWFASHCTGTDYPADGTWLGGNWSVEDDEDDGGEVTDTMYGVDDALPGVPTSGPFVPTATSGGSVSSTSAGTTITLNNGGYVELSDGTRYTCTSTDGCTIENGTVTRGVVAGRPAGSGDGEVDRFPSFRTAVNPGGQTYTVGTAIDTLTLPDASGGNGTLGYSLSPDVPGLSYNDTTRQLTGAPSAAGTYAMTYTVTDEDEDTDTLGFTITVESDSSTGVADGDCYVGLLVRIGESCTYPGTTDEFSVNVRGRGSFLDRLAGIRIRITNETINGRVYDFEASHQGDGVWRIDRVANST